MSCCKTGYSGGMCGVLSGRCFWFKCTRPEGHLGDHIACGPTGRGKKDHRFFQWPQLNKKEVENE